MHQVSLNQQDLLLCIDQPQKFLHCHCIAVTDSIGAGRQYVLQIIEQ